jgi:hypothetical protein
MAEKKKENTRKDSLVADSSFWRRLENLSFHGATLHSLLPPITRKGDFIAKCLLCIKQSTFRDQVEVSWRILYKSEY